MDAVAWGRPCEKLNEGSNQTHSNDQTHSSEDDDNFVTVVRKRHSQSNAALSQKFRNGGMTDFSGRGKEFQTNQRQERRRNFRDRERHKFQSDGRDPRDGRPGVGERNRNHNKYQHNAVPSQQQPPTSHNQNTISSRSNNSTNSNNQSSYDRRRSGVTNGSICSESGSSSFGTTESFVNSNNSNGLLDLDPPHQIVNQIEPPSVENHPVRHLSGESVSGSASISVSEADNMHAEIAQSSEESTQPQYVSAPVPAVNPWRINPNAASILSKKAPLVAQKQSTNVMGKSPIPPKVESVAKKPNTLSTPKIEKKSTTISKRTDKDKTNSNTVKTPIISQPGEQSVTVVSNKSTMIQVDSSKETTATQPSQQLTDVGQDAFTPTRRAFAAVTRNQKIGFEIPKIPVARASPKDWPSLQETVIIPGANPINPTAVQSKPVISGADKAGRNFPQKNGNHSSGASSLTDSDDSTIYNQVQKEGLPSDKWPSISDAAVTEDAKISNAYLKQNGATDTDTIASQILISEAVDHLTLKDSGIESEPRFTENGSFSSSDDNEPSAADNELDIEAAYEKGKKGKKLKQKWVPLSLPETPTAKSRMRKAQSMEREKVEKEVRAKEKVYLHKGSSDKPTLNDGRVNQTYVPRGRGRASGVRGRNNNRGRILSQHWNYGETLDGIMISPGEEYPDYPPDYTTLPAMYPVSEFIMPYDYYGSYSPSIGIGADDTQTAVPTTYVPVDDAVVSDMVKNQIEYYFSEENLEKDFYLRRKMDDEGYLPITFIATFPRVKNMTLDYNVVLQAIQFSPELELKADLSCVRTKHDPIKWPILDETTLGLPLPPILPQNQATLMAHNTSNGYFSLSVTASPVPLTSFTIGEKLNPNVPEFVPKLKVVESS